MERKISLRNYTAILSDIICTSILSNPLVLVVSITTIIFCLYSGRLNVQATQEFKKLIGVFKKPEFNQSLVSFLKFGLFAATFNYIPQAVFNFFLQYIYRDKFVSCLESALKLNYTTFHSKTPGEHQYMIFIKAKASPMICQLLVVDFTSLVGNIIFGTSFVSRDVDTTTALLFLCSPLIYLVTVGFYIKNKMKYYYDFLAQQQNTSSKLADKLLNYETIKAYNLEETEAQDFFNVVGAQTKSTARMGNYEAKCRYLLTFSTNVPYIFIMCNMALQREKSDSVADFLTLALLYVGQASSLRRLSRELDTLFDYLNQITFLSVSNPEDYGREVDLALEPIFNEKISFVDTDIYYGDKLIVKGINLCINKGEKVAIVGQNGTGKSTFIKSILGFIDYKGEICFDNSNLKKLDPKKIMDLISYIPQDDCTSNDTVLNNLLLGLNKKDQETLTLDQQKQKIKNLARKFNADETFKALEKGYETETGPRGNKLSGGQRQKISLIRACLKNAPIFVFDEATASLDKKYEKETIEMIFEHLRDKTILMIVHGTDYLRKFDKLVFLNNGGVEGVGTFNELSKDEVFLANIK